MKEPEVARAVNAVISNTSELGLAVDDALTLHNSNKLALRLLPCDTFARVAHGGYEVAQREVELARKLSVPGALWLLLSREWTRASTGATGS